VLLCEFRKRNSKQKTASKKEAATCSQRGKSKPSTTIRNANSEPKALRENENCVPFQ